MGAITASPPDVLLVSQLTSLRLAVDPCERYDRRVFRSNCHTLHGTTPAQAKLLSDEERVVALHRMKEERSQRDNGGRRVTRTIQLALDSYGIAEPMALMIVGKNNESSKSSQYPT